MDTEEKGRDINSINKYWQGTKQGGQQKVGPESQAAEPPPGKKAGK